MSGKTDQLAQAIIFAIYIPDDRAKKCLRSTYLVPCRALETRSCSIEKRPLKDWVMV